MSVSYIFIAWFKRVKVDGNVNSLVILIKLLLSYYKFITRGFRIHGKDGIICSLNTHWHAIADVGDLFVIYYRTDN